MGKECPKCHFENPDDSKFCKECGTQIIPLEEITVTETLETPKEELTTGSTFAGRYQIIEELGKGGMGKVYRVLDKELKEEVALKLIKPEIASDKKTLERFSNELKLARKISHKNVSRMYELMEEKGTRYITMEYVLGQDLRGLIKQSGQLAVGTTINIAKQVGEGLSEAHKLGVVHRDLKPQNIMIDKEGNVRIMDFGIARSLTAKGITGAGVMIGTPEYMSPEQAEVKEVDQRSDIYSLGVIFYEMVTGRVPFEGETPLGIAMKHKSEMPKDPRELNSQIPKDLSLVILRCMEKNKEKRYQSAGEVRSELENIEKGIPTTERVIPKRKPITSKEITVTFGLKKLFIPALVVAALIIIAVVIWRPWSQKETVPIPSDKPSIAVLPFEDLSLQKDQEYFCDGLAEELINRLTNIEDLKVPARTSAFSFKGKDLDYREIGEKLNVEMVLDGSVRKEGNKLRITIQLIKVADGFPVWSKTYQRNIEDTFDLWDEISLAIVDNLKIKLLGREKAKLVKRYTENIEAYNRYIKGRYFWNKRTKEGFKKGVEYFEQAIEEDPSYTLAYAGLADCYNLLGDYIYLPPKEAFPKAKEAALKALSIDNTLAEAHTSLAFVLSCYDWDWEGAEREYNHAIELNPGYAITHLWYAHFLANLKRHDEAIAEIKRAQELDPLSLIINNEVGHIFYKARQYDKAIEAFQKTLEMNPEFWKTQHDLAFTYLQKGMYGEAIKKIQKAKEFSKGLVLYHDILIGTAYVRMGKIEEARKVLHNLLEGSKQVYVLPSIADIYFALGENDQGFKWLERAYEERLPWMKALKIDPAYDNVRSDPRFKALLKKMNLE